MDILNDFLEAEIFSEEFYRDIMFFINSYEIRRGEFEGNEFIILKVNRENFILYPEYDDGETGIQIPCSMSIYKDDLIDAIEKYVKRNGHVFD